jgi:hypothetical protein
MTAKEKAKELYDKYEFVYIANYTSKYEVKKCVLLLVDEIIEIIGNDLDIDCLNFWQTVRLEAEKF